MSWAIPPVSGPQVRSTRPAGARVSPASGPRVIDAVATREQDSGRQMSGAAQRDGAQPRPQPAGMLYAMFEQMGGAATSVWKGMHVNTVI